MCSSSGQLACNRQSSNEMPFLRASRIIRHILIYISVMHLHNLNSKGPIEKDVFDVSSGQVQLYFQFCTAVCMYRLDLFQKISCTQRHAYFMKILDYFVYHNLRVGYLRRFFVNCGMMYSSRDQNYVMAYEVDWLVFFAVCSM